MSNLHTHSVAVEANRDLINILLGFICREYWGRAFLLLFFFSLFLFFVVF